MLKLSHVLFAAASAVALSAGGAQAQTQDFQINPGAVFQQATPPPSTAR